VTGRGAVLAGRILAELQELSILVQRAEQGWAKARDSQDDFFLDGAAGGKTSRNVRYCRKGNHCLRRIPAKHQVKSFTSRKQELPFWIQDHRGRRIPAPFLQSMIDIVQA
jgi:hypothetical protein